MNYAPGLDVEWTPEEEAKIKEIKNRPNRGKQYHKPISWENHEEMIKLELKHKRIQAIKLLDECGIEKKMIADLFNIPIMNVRMLLR